MIFQNLRLRGLVFLIPSVHNQYHYLNHVVEKGRHKKKLITRRRIKDG
jgi:hypothetical protein